MGNEPSELIRPRSKLAKFAVSLFLRRLALAFLLTAFLLACYIWLHIPFSYPDATGRAATSVSYRFDILTTWLIAVAMALVLGRISARCWLRLVLLLVSCLVLIAFIFACFELHYRTVSPNWVRVIAPLEWIEPFRGRSTIPSNLGQTIVPENFNGTGIILSFLSIGSTFRELNWYWVVVPIVDTRYRFPDWSSIALLNLVFSAAIVLIGGATAVVATTLQDIVRSRQHLFHILHEGSHIVLARAQLFYLAWKRIPPPARRITLAFLLTTALLAIYSRIHILFSYLDSSGRVITSIPYTCDILVAYLMVIAATLTIGRIQTSRGSRWASLISYFLFLVIYHFIISCFELWIRKSHPNWSGWIASNPWIEPFGGKNIVPSSLSQVIVPENFTLGGVYSSILTAANTFRELNWYWIVVPVLDQKYPFPGWLPVISLNLILAATLTLVGVAISVLIPIPRDILGLLQRVPRILYKRVIVSDRLYMPPKRAHRWSPWQRWLFRIAPICIILANFILVVAAILANAQIPHLTWETQSIYIPSYSNIRAFLLLDNGTVLVGTEQGVFCSDDRGRSWNSVSTGLTNTDIQALVLDPRDGSVLASTAKGIFRSASRGQSWAITRLPIASIRALVLDGQDRTLFVSTDRGVFRSSDGGQKWDAGAGLVGIGAWALALDPQHGAVFASTEKGVFRSLDRGWTWKPIDTLSWGGINLGTLLIDPRDGTLYVTDYSHVIRSTDGGHSWDASPNLWSTIQTLILNPRDGTLFVGTDDGVFRSSDKGESWEAADVGLTNTRTNALLLYPQDGTLLAGTDDRGAFRSTDWGHHWESACTGLPTSTRAWALALDPRDGTVFAGTRGGGVFRSTNRGRSWQSVSAGLTNTEIYALVVDPQHNNLFAGTEGGVFRSIDRGSHWEAASTGLTDMSVNALVRDPRDGTLFVGTEGGVFRSVDQGQSWEKASAGLPGTSAWALAIDPQDGTLFVGTGRGEGVYYSTDRGRHWTATGTELNYLAITALVIDPHDGMLFAGTVGKGVFLSSDRGQSWEIASSGLSNMKVWALMLDPRDSTLLASTIGEGVFRSADRGRNWESVSNGLTIMSARALALNPKDGTLYAATDGGGVFESTNGASSWNAINTGLADTLVEALTVDSRNGTLFVATNNGVFRSTDEGRNWESANNGLPDVSTTALALDQRDETLFVGTNDHGVFRSTDGGESWEGDRFSFFVSPEVNTLALDPQNGTLFASLDNGALLHSAGRDYSWNSQFNWDSNFPGEAFRALEVDPRSGTLFAETAEGVLRSTDRGSTWSKMDYLSGLSIVQTQGGYPIWSYNLSDNTLAVFSNIEGNPVPVGKTVDVRSIVLQPLSAERTEILTAWGATLGRAQINTASYMRETSWWLVIRGWIQRVPYFLASNSKGISLGLGLALPLIILVVYVVAYITWAYPYGIPPGKFLTVFPWRPANLPDFAHTSLDRAWPTWRSLIQNLLLWWGEATSADLRSIPRPYQHWALQQYIAEKNETQPLKLRQNRLELLADNRPGIWLEAWFICARELSQTPGLTSSARDAIDRMAQAFRTALGLRVSLPHDWTIVRAYSVEAPTLKLNVPRSFPLVFIADPHPDDETVKTLSECVDMLRETGYFALIVPLAPSQSTVDIPAELRRWLLASPRVDDFIILSLNDTLDILSARNPNARLIEQILGQVDLKTISPFQDSGPCPPNMFFGREREIKQIVEGIVRGDYAVVGNRKAGKTSLLQRVQMQLSSDGRFYPIFINGQNIRDIVDFYREFETVSSLTLSDYTPEAFEQVIRTLASTRAFPVLLLDEVDALLDSDAQAKEKLSGTWRKLAQDGITHFVLVGTATLARRLRDPSSVFFNFAQRLPLKYLPQEVAELVISEPLDILGLILEPQDKVLKRIVDLASGHPNLLQTLGRRLVERVSNEHKQVITFEDCEAIARDEDFTDFYLDVIWGLVQPLEKLVTLIAPGESFEIEDIERSLSRYEVSVEPENLDDALEMLEVYAILRREDRHYTFNPGHFREILSRTQELGRLIDIEKRKLIRLREKS
jgi:ligand-binding sensor domain-containing protein